MHATHSLRIVGPDDEPATSDGSVLPTGDLLHLAGRGNVFVRQIPGPADAPCLILLHGWTATADLNWHACYGALGRHYRVIAFDHRGHGRGLRAASPFSLEDCADDVAAVADLLGVDQFIPVGYSMGGPIASLVWQRHRSMVQGLVLCATTRHFADTRRRRAIFSLLNGTSTLATTPPIRALGQWSSSAWSRRLERRGDAPWTVEQVMLHDWTQILEAGRAIGRFDSRSWAVEIDVPTAVIATLDDEIVPTPRQIELAHAVPGASLHVVPGGHTACSDRSGRFVPTLLDACRSVADRSATTPVHDAA